MSTISFLEDHISQIPALQMLQKLGYKYITPKEALNLRDGKMSQVILDDILRKQLHKLNKISISSNKTSVFSDANIEKGIQAIKDLPFNEGYISASEYVYNLLTLGKTLEQSIDGDKKSYNLQYIDWENPQNNVFHVTEEFEVLRAGLKKSYIPDIVLFINGIPICIIECKRPDIKKPIEEAVSQHLRNQQEDGIRPLYVYSQLLMSIATNKALYATTGTLEEFWAHWNEKFETETQEKEYKEKISTLKNTHLSLEQKNKLFSDRFKYVRNYFDDLGKEEILPSLQDEYILNLCEPTRLLSLIFGFIVYDDGIKKIARYQQYFSINKTIKRISKISGGKRKGGVIWHTQGSGKSLTMVMLAQEIARNKNIKNPKIILVTDRTDLDKQIWETFIACGLNTFKAGTGSHLIELLEGKSDAVVTTVINKFEAAVRKIKEPLISHDIFVLIDEGHRTQYGSFNIQMQKTLPNACFIAMTGTPLMKKEKSTADKFGGVIDKYTVDQAVEDGAVVPLLYEGRNASQKVNSRAIDLYFERISNDLTDKQKADLKKKFSRADQLNIAKQKIHEIAWDISIHFKENWQGTGFKAQLVCQNKESAIKYKKYLDEIGIVTSDVVISPPDEREGEDSVFEKSEDIIKRFWDRMMAEHGNAKKYNDNIISRYKNKKDPEIIIVVDKLLTGFDVPKNTVLYLTRSLKEHTLLQAIARVNRVAENKPFGYIIDYYGVLSELDEALKTFSGNGDFEADDLKGIFSNISIEIEKLPQKHSDLWSVFKTVKNKHDLEAFEQLLRDEEKREDFYNKLREYGKSLKVALSSIEFHNNEDSQLIETYKKDMNMFYKIRQSVASRFSDEIDYKKYEGQIQKLIDTHISTDKVTTIVEEVNIFEREKFNSELEKTEGEAAKADKIASRTSKYIREKMEEDPAFYKKFSEMLKDTIKAYEEHRINETEYLKKVTEIMENVLAHKDDSFPEEIRAKDTTKAFYGVACEFFEKNAISKDFYINLAISISLLSDNIFEEMRIVDWQSNIDVVNSMKMQIFDMVYDEVKSKAKLDISISNIDSFIEKIIGIAKIKY
ncbi:restriction endonuclease subunit R [Candidatus Gracilibacteria bacterium]|nr:MAG: restriction endonuclease subunit R [Candidatus Gracilibacteria bacterium]PIE85595.1 MAG: restriction endonuclease subunit R [Candidatus Gracilibacteria bacterium]